MDAPRAARPDNDAEATVTVRYWAAIKAAAERAEDVVPSAPGQSVADVLAVVRERHRDSARFQQVLGVCSLLVDERPVGAADPETVPVGAGALVDVLPPFAGG